MQLIKLGGIVLHLSEASLLSQDYLPDSYEMA